MRKTAFAAALVAAFFAAGTAHALHCPADMAKIDAALAANPTLTAEQMANVTKLRAEGEALHKAGDHAKSVEVLAEAMAILGIK